MKLFLDTADLEEIREGLSLGVIDGMTTNPSLVAKTGRPFESVAREICELVDGPVSLEGIATAADRIVEEGRRLAAIHLFVTGYLRALGAFAVESLSASFTL